MTEEQYERAVEALACLIRPHIGVRTDKDYPAARTESASPSE
jgi:hypothetical protein